jgi:hypothetical protein
MSRCGSSARRIRKCPTGERYNSRSDRGLLTEGIHMKIHRRDGSLICTIEGTVAGTLNSALLDDLDLSNAVLDDVTAEGVWLNGSDHALTRRAGSRTAIAQARRPASVSHVCAFQLGCVTGGVGLRSITSVQPHRARRPRSTTPAVLRAAPASQGGDQSPRPAPCADPRAALAQ